MINMFIHHCSCPNIHDMTYNVIYALLIPVFLLIRCKDDFFFILFIDQSKLYEVRFVDVLGKLCQVLFNHQISDLSIK